MYICIYVYMYICIYMCNVHVCNGWKWSNPAFEMVFHAKNDQLFAGPVWSPKTDPAMWGRCHLLAEWYPANLKVPVVQCDFRVTMVTSGFHESWSNHDPGFHLKLRHRSISGWDKWMPCNRSPGQYHGYESKNWVAICSNGPTKLAASVTANGLHHSTVWWLRIQINSDQFRSWMMITPYTQRYPNWLVQPQINIINQLGNWGRSQRKWQKNVQALFPWVCESLLPAGWRVRPTGLHGRNGADFISGFTSVKSKIRPKHSLTGDGGLTRNRL